jgi:hypothetical protein
VTVSDAIIIAIAHLCNVQIKVLPRVDLPAQAYYEPRRRYRAEKLLPFLQEKLPGDGDRILGLTGVDISTARGSIEDWGILNRFRSALAHSNSSGRGLDAAHREHLHYFEMNSREHESNSICVSPWAPGIRNHYRHAHYDQHCRSPRQELFTIAHTAVHYCSQRL